MIPQNFEYSAPSNLNEALALLAGGNAKVLAGGMPVLTQSSVAVCVPTGTPLNVLVTQTRVTGT